MRHMPEQPFDLNGKTVIVTGAELLVDGGFVLGMNGYAGLDEAAER